MVLTWHFLFPDLLLFLFCWKSTHTFLTFLFISFSVPSLGPRLFLFYLSLTSVLIIILAWHFTSFDPRLFFIRVKINHFLNIHVSMSKSNHTPLSCPLRFLGFCRSTSKRFTTSSVESMYRNLISSMYDTPPSVWGSLTSSRFSSLSFITIDTVRHVPSTGKLTEQLHVSRYVTWRDVTWRGVTLFSKKNKKNWRERLSL